MHISTCINKEWVAGRLVYLFVSHIQGRHQESHSTDKLISKNGGTGPPQDHHQDADNDHGDTQLDKLENSNNNDANGAEGPGVEASLATETPRFTKYQPKCEVTEKEAISAISRAKTVQCKQELADVACLHMENKLYKTYLPRFCPLRGEFCGFFQQKQHLWTYLMLRHSSIQKTSNIFFVK